MSNFDRVPSQVGSIRQRPEVDDCREQRLEGLGPAAKMGRILEKYVKIEGNKNDVMHKMIK